MDSMTLRVHDLPPKPGTHGASFLLFNVAIRIKVTPKQTQGTWPVQTRIHYPLNRKFSTTANSLQPQLLYMLCTVIRQIGNCFSNHG